MPDHQIEPCLLFVFGAMGDLMHRKLLPALHRLASQGKLGDQYQILGVAQPKLDDRTYRQWACEALESARSEAGDSIGAWCAQRLHYHPSGDGSAEDLRGLAAEIDALEKQHGLPGNRLFYLALPPQAFPPVIAGLGQAGLDRSRGWTRIVVEKPFGRDLATAEELNRLAHKYFDESQVYRIDHYLGKETVQNLLAFRFANPIFETLWNRVERQVCHLGAANHLARLLGFECPPALPLPPL